VINPEQCFPILFQEGLGRFYQHHAGMFIEDFEKFLDEYFWEDLSYTKAIKTKLLDMAYEEIIRYVDHCMEE
jgi:hypothetical protein